MHAGRFCVMVCALALVTACEARRGTIVSTTIDMRCRSNTDCPSGFACAHEAEHGPPITLCESDDPTIACPPGYDIKVRYGQRFCKPRRDLLGPVSVGPRAATASCARAATAGSARASRAGDGRAGR